MFKHLFNMLSNNKGFWDIAASGIGSLFGGKKKGGGMQVFDPRSGAQKEGDDYSANQSMWMGDQLQDKWGQIQQGQLPAWLTDYMNQSEQFQKKNLKNLYYGDTGGYGPNLADQAVSGAAMFTGNPKAGMNAVNKLGQGYAQQFGDIDYNRQAQGANYLGSWEQNLPGMIKNNRYQSGMQPQIQQPQEEQSNPWGALLGQGISGLLGNQGFQGTMGNIFSKVGNMFGGSTPTYTGQNWDQGSLDKYFSKF